MKTLFLIASHPYKSQNNEGKTYSKDFSKQFLLVYVTADLTFPVPL